MHYQNGRPARVGDIIHTKDGEKGVVVQATPGSSSCNLLVRRLQPGVEYHTAGECQHADDFACKPYPSVGVGG